ncbi:MAG: Arc family DNA-binding protein [Flavobacteriaceae bacterium]
MRDKYPSELAERFQVRCPLGLRDKIKELAAHNKRSMNSEIIARLAESVGEPEPLAEEAQCGNCRFFLGGSTAQGDMCRRYPPNNRHPALTVPTGWCGEWRAR